ncbi:MAG: SUMF1/EgtB/PvdO family nonheme iron enzyme [Candidatus Marinimicrobia bacterium]|nr:SUMF1/EgtB/PvdO family nonheme iron enzyme [Candidatus Neomarinimicrobiota bacterium]
MKNSHKILLVPYSILILIVSCVDYPNLNVFNSYNDIFLEYVNITSYDDSSIRINISASIEEKSEVEFDSLMVFREIIMLNDTIPDYMFVIPISEDAIYIDSTNIVPNTEYLYSFQFTTSMGNSSNIGNTSIDHRFPAVDNLELERTSYNDYKLEWDWDCPFETYFSNIVDSISFEIMKFTLLETKNSFDSTSFIYVSEYSETGHYLFEDEIGGLYDSVYFHIKVVGNEHKTEAVYSNTVTFSFPNINYDWIPLNSSEIFIEWSYDETIIDCTVVHNQNTDNYEIVDSDFYIEHFSDDHDIADLLQYTLIWCADTACDSVEFCAKTLPIHSMQFIPSIVGYPESNDTLGAFYIDMFEITSEQFDSPALNTPGGYFGKYPKNDIKINEAREFCNDRSVNVSDIDFFQQVYDDFGPINLKKVGFRLPTMAEWTIASGYSFESEHSIVDYDSNNLCQYPNPICDGYIDCSYINFQGSDDYCENGVLPVGSYNGEGFSFEQVVSSSGLYDTSGNLSEWVENEMNLRELACAMGGSFSDGYSDVTSSSVIFVDSDLQYTSIGFRTVIPARQFIKLFKERILEEDVN